MMTPEQRVIVSTAHTRLWLARRTLERLVVDRPEVEPVLVDVRDAIAKLDELNERPSLIGA